MIRRLCLGLSFFILCLFFIYKKDSGIEIEDFKFAQIEVSRKLGILSKLDLTKALISLKAAASMERLFSDFFSTEPIVGAVIMRGNSFSAIFSKDKEITHTSAFDGNIGESWSPICEKVESKTICAYTKKLTRSVVFFDVVKNNVYLLCFLFIISFLLSVIFFDILAIRKEEKNLIRGIANFNLPNKIKNKTYLLKGPTMEIAKAIQSANKVTEERLEAKRSYDDLAFLAQQISHDTLTAWLSMGAYVSTVKQIFRQKNIPEIFDPKSTVSLLSRSLEAHQEYMEDLMNDLLCLNKEEPVQIVDVELKAIVLRSVDIVKSIYAGISKHEITLAHTKIPRASWDIHRVFNNLVKNAFEAATYGGNVWIKTQDDEKGILVAIGNTGQLSSDPDNLFQPFKTGKHQGHGLGLTIVKKILDAHKVEISVRTPEDLSFVEFRFILPARLPA